MVEKNVKSIPQVGDKRNDVPEKAGASKFQGKGSRFHLHRATLENKGQMQAIMQ